MTAAPLNRQQHAAQMRTRGYSVAAIAAEMNICEGTVYTHLRRAEESGLSVRPDPAIALVGDLPDDIRAWLAEITPEGASVQDTIRAIVTDAYYEEQRDD